VNSANRIGVIGLGKLGLPLALSLSKYFEVTGLDKNEELISCLARGEYKGIEPAVAELLTQQLGMEAAFSPSTSISDLLDTSCVYIILPTPSTQSGLFDDKLVRACIQDLIELWERQKEDKVIVIVSTLSPGASDKIYSDLILPSNRRNQFVISLVYSPEFIALGSVLHDLEHPDMVLVGTHDGNPNKTHENVQQILAKSQPQVVNLNYTEAEYSKILVNTYITMKISFANFIGEIGSKLDNFNPARVAYAIGLDNRINHRYLKPGLPFSGPCFPRDNRALIASTKEIGLHASLAMATDEINNRQILFLAEKVLARSKSKKSFCIFGLAYKVGSEVIEHSPGLQLANFLAAKGFQVQCHDPALSSRPEGLNPNVNFSNDLQGIDNYDQGVVLTDWPIYREQQNSLKNLLYISLLDV